MNKGYDPSYEKSPAVCDSCFDAPPSVYRWEGINSKHIYAGAQRCRDCYRERDWRLRASDRVWVWQLDPELALEDDSEVIEV